MASLMEHLESRALFSAGLTGQYFSGSNFNTAKFSRTDATLNFNWGAKAPDARLSATNFSVRWTGYVKPKFNQKYTFITDSNDGVRVWVGGQLIINQFKDQWATWRGSVNLAAGKNYTVRVDYFQDKGTANMKLSWSSPSTAQQVIPSSALATTVTTSTTTPPPTTPPKTPTPPTPPPKSTTPPPSTTTNPPPPPPASVVYSGPIKITHGGTYSGNWESDDPTLPAVIVNTSDPVIITSSNIRSRGTLIATWASHSDVTIQNTNGTALNPNVAGKSPGRFLDDEHFDNIVVKNCSMTGTTGIYLDTYSGDDSSSQTIKILNNTALDIDGRHSDGNGGFVSYETRTRKSDGHTDTGYDVVQFVQIAKATNVPGIEVAGNHVVNEPGKSRVEDTISVFLSSGTSSSPIRIHDNYINGAYNIAPWQSNYSDDNYSYDYSYSGGGIMLGDGTPGDNTSPCAYVQAYNNTVIDTTNYGIAITSGHDLQFYDNNIYSSGKLKDGRTIQAQNVGAAIWNGNGQSSFYNDGGHDNQVNWMDHGQRNDWWVPSADNWDNNVHTDKTWS